MSDSREAYVKWRQDRGIRIGDDPIPATEFWDAAWQAAQAQAQAVNQQLPAVWIRSDDLARAMIASEGERAEVAPDKEDGFDVPLYRHPQPAVNRQDLIDLLVATHTQSEGVTADLIIKLLDSKPESNQHFPEGFTKWLNAFVKVSNAAGIEDQETAWTWPSPPNNPEFFAGYPNLTTGDLRALRAIAAAQVQGGGK
jgi:hypothetical protein